MTTTSTRITTEILGARPALSQIRIDQPDSELSTSWVRGGDGVIGFGIYAQTKVSGSHRFQDASRWWREELAKLTIENNVHGSGTGPILFTSFAFNEDEPSELVIPRVIVGRKGEKAWITWIGNMPQPKLSIAEPSQSKPELIVSQGGLSESDWMNRVEQAISKIKAGDLEKIVLARDSVVQSDTPLDIQLLLQALEREYPSTWIFLVEDLIGATPELLVRLSKSLVTSRVLAGTIRRTGDEAKDLALAGSLAKSSKDLEEHEYAVRSVADALAPYCSSTNVPESPFVLHLANVMHLATDVTGVVNESASRTDIFTLIEALHPSAAVCGTPTPVAKKTIDELEGISRGRYAGPIGWIDARGDGEIGIALRCGQFNESHDQVRLFAGCGIVAGSVPQDELAESQAKLIPMRTALAML
jgi:menaquinone-specific isochorismate synthase